MIQEGSKKKIKTSDDTLVMPCKPMAMALRFTDNMTWQERNKAYLEYNQELRTYRARVAAYVKQNGAKGLPMTKIRIFFASECIITTGGRRILEDRFNRYVAGEEVPRSFEHRYQRPLPTYTLLEKQPHRIFDTTDLRCVPMDLLAMHLFPYMDNCALFHFMLTCRQFQAYAHRELLFRAQDEFGSGGTPMALHAKFSHGCSTAYLSEKIRQYKCIDNYQTNSVYQAEQIKIKRQDSICADRFKREDLEFVQGVVTKVLGANFTLKLSPYCARAKCLFSNTDFITIMDWMYPKRSGKLITLCSTFTNAGERNAEHMTKLLRKHKLQQEEYDLIQLFMNETIQRYINSKCSTTYEAHVSSLLKAMAKEVPFRGLQWARNLVFTYEAYKHQSLEYNNFISFVFHADGSMDTLNPIRDTVRIKGLLENGYMMGGGLYTKR
jgi:hypothetical protein